MWIGAELMKRLTATVCLRVAMLWVGVFTWSGCAETQAGDATRGTVIEWAKLEKDNPDVHEATVSLANSIAEGIIKALYLRNPGEEGGTAGKLAKNDPTSQRVTREFAQAVAQGVIDGLTASDVQTKISRFTDGLVASASKSASEAIRNQLAGALAEALSHASAGVFRGAKDGIQDLGPVLNRLAVQMSHSVVKGMAAGLNDSLLPTLGKGLGQVADGLGPALNNAGEI